MTKKKVPEATTIHAYKGFDKNLQCRGYQFAVGETYTHEGEVAACRSGFHSCTHPLGVLRYYPPATSRFAEVEASGKIANHNDDSKIASGGLKIKAETGLKGLIDAGIKFAFSKVTWGKEDTPQTHGNYSAAQTHGNYSAAQTHGKESVAVSTGAKGRAAGALGNWLVLAEWSNDKITSVQTVHVDGEIIKADTFYALTKGVFTEVK